MSKTMLSLGQNFNSKTLAETRKQMSSPNSGRRIVFDGDPAILYPVIGGIYEVQDFAHKTSGSGKRPMVLIGYYQHGGKAVACDFISSSSTSQNPDPDYDLDRYDLLLRKKIVGYRQSSTTLCGNATLTLANNKTEIIKDLPVGNICSSLLADYLLRRFLVLYEQKARWKKDAAIPENAVRHGFILEGVDLEACRIKDRVVPDVPNAEHRFEQVLTGPRFIADNIDQIHDWARKAVAIKRATGFAIPLPGLKSFPDWPSPASLIKCRQAQIDYAHSLQ